METSTKHFAKATLAGLLLASFTLLVSYNIGFSQGRKDYKREAINRANKVWADSNSYLKATNGVGCEVDYIIFGECQL